MEKPTKQELKDLVSDAKSYERRGEALIGLLRLRQDEHGQEQALVELFKLSKSYDLGAVPPEQRAEVAELVLKLQRAGSLTLKMYASVTKMTDHWFYSSSGSILPAFRRLLPEEAALAETVHLLEMVHGTRVGSITEDVDDPWKDWAERQLKRTEKHLNRKSIDQLLVRTEGPSPSEQAKAVACLGQLTSAMSSEQRQAFTDRLLTLAAGPGKDLKQTAAYCLGKMKANLRPDQCEKATEVLLRLLDKRNSKEVRKQAAYTVFVLGESIPPGMRGSVVLRLLDSYDLWVPFGRQGVRKVFRSIPHDVMPGVVARLLALIKRGWLERFAFEDLHAYRDAIPPQMHAAVADGLREYLEEEDWMDTITIKSRRRQTLARQILSSLDERSG